MENNTLSHPLADIHHRLKVSRETSPLQKFIKWSGSLQPHRVMLLAGFLLFHGNVTIPMTMYSMYFAEAGAIQFLMMTLFTMIIVVTNLSAQPTKITVPAFIVGTTVHLGMIMFNLFFIL